MATDQRHLTRLDEDNYLFLRNKAFQQRTTTTELVNALLRCAIPLAEAGAFHLGPEALLAAVADQLRPRQPQE